MNKREGKVNWKKRALDGECLEKLNRDAFENVNREYKTWKERAVKADLELEKLRATLIEATRVDWKTRSEELLERLEYYARKEWMLRGIVAILLLTVTLALIALCWWYAPRLLQHQIEMSYPVDVSKPCDLILENTDCSKLVNDKDEKIIQRLQRRVRHLEQRQ